MEDKLKKKLYYVFVLGIILLLFVRDIVGLNYNKFILVGYCILFFVILPANPIAKMLSFIFPLTWGLPYTYIFLFGFIIFIVKRKRIPSLALLLIVLLLLLEIIASFWCASISLPLIVKYISTVSVFFVFLYDEAIDKEKCIEAFYIGVVVLCLFIIIMTIKTAPSNWLYLFSRGWFRFGREQVSDTEGIMLAVNANTLAYYSVVGISLAFKYIFESEGRSKWLHIAYLALFVVSGVFTLSISWIVTAFLCFLLFAFVQAKSWKTVVASIFALLVVAFAVSKIIVRTPELLGGFITRLTTTDLSTGHHRTELMLEYHNLFWSNIRFVLLGTGVTQYREVTKAQYSFHNMIQQIFVSYGLFGGFAFFTGMFAPFRKLRKHAASLLYWIPFFSVMVFTQTIQFINPESLMLPFVITFFVLKVQTEKVDFNEALHHNG